MYHLCLALERQRQPRYRIQETQNEKGEEESTEVINTMKILEVL